MEPMGERAFPRALLECPLSAPAKLSCANLLARYGVTCSSLLAPLTLRFSVIHSSFDPARSDGK